MSTSIELLLENRRFLTYGIKTIVFDLGGVIFKEGKSVALENLYKTYQYDKKIVFDILWSHKSIDLRKGIIEDWEFWDWAQGQVPEEYNVLNIKRAWYDGYILDKDMLGIVKRLYRRYRLVIFSGNIKSRIEYLERKYHFRKYFDLEIYSYDYHVTKPDKKFIEILIGQLGGKPEEMVYIDDVEECVIIAKSFGINAIVYESGKVRRLENELRGFGIDLSKT